jgi:hypothetical protein
LNNIFFAKHFGASFRLPNLFFERRGAGPFRRQADTVDGLTCGPKYRKNQLENALFVGQDVPDVKSKSALKKTGVISSGTAQ